MADRIFASVVNQKTVTQVQLQVLTIIAAIKPPNLFGQSHTNLVK